VVTKGGEGNEASLSRHVDEILPARSAGRPARGDGHDNARTNDGDDDGKRGMQEHGQDVKTSRKCRKGAGTDGNGTDETSPNEEWIVLHAEGSRC